MSQVTVSGAECATLYAPVKLFASGMGLHMMSPGALYEEDYEMVALSQAMASSQCKSQLFIFLFHPGAGMLRTLITAMSSEMWIRMEISCIV